MIKGKENLKIYRCPECGLEYLQKEWAEKCREWCLQYKSCNLEITKYSINKKILREEVKK